MLDAMDTTTKQDQQELERLRSEFGDEYALWRSVEGRYWIATARDKRVCSEPTLMEESAAALEEKLRAPGDRVAVPFQREAL